MFEENTLRLNADQEELDVGRNEASPSPIDDIETQMRRALGLYGRRSKVQTEREQGEPASHTKDRSGNPIRRRFVQDGEVPVTVVRRDAAVDGGGPSSSPL